MSVHSHRRRESTGQRELATALIITVSMMAVELVGGLMSGSLALLADAGHMLADASALSLSLFASWMSARPATPAKTYGYYRTEILAALINGVALWLIVFWIVSRAVHRFHNPPDIHSGVMLIAACLGLGANVASSRILFRARTSNLNMQGAWLHVIADMVGSCGVIIAALLIRVKGWRVADPLASVLIGLLIAASSWVLVKQSVNVLLEGVPAHLNVDEVLRALRQVAGVHDVHDIHLWTITTGLEAMSGHLVVEHLVDGPAILEAANRTVSQRFGITHTTFQLEPRTKLDS